MRVCLNKTTGRIIESQSGGTTAEHLDTLKINAVNAGYNEADIVVKYMDDAEFEAMLNTQIEAEKTYKQRRLREYGSIADQLDMLYWDKVNNTNTWIAHIANIKAKYPKIQGG